MTRITIYKKNRQIIGFKALGHAGYAEAGEDIVCASVSVLTINTINSIETFTSAKSNLSCDEECGMIDFRIVGNSGKDVKLLLDAMVLGLETIAEDNNYSNYMDITYEEV